MAELAPFAMVHTLDQWRRVAHEGTALEKYEDDFAVVQLAWTSDERSDVADEDQPIALTMAAMAFDPWCRLYRSRPEHNQIEKMLWATKDDNTEFVPLFSAPAVALGDFSSVQALASDDAKASSIPQAETEQSALTQQSTLGPLQQPADIVIDKSGRLFVSEFGAGRVLIYDLMENKLLRYVFLKYPVIKLATDGKQVWALIKSTQQQYALAIFDARSAPRYLPLPNELNAPGDLVIGDDIYLLDQAGSSEAKIVPLNAVERAFHVPFASTILLKNNTLLVVARRAGEDFLRFELDQHAQTELPFLKARHYDGRGIVLTPDGDIAYWSHRGLLRATLARVRYESRGHITTFQLDSNDFQTQWGRLFIDACLPRGTSVKARFLALDEVPSTAELLAHSAPENMIDLTITQPHLSPLPPKALLDNVLVTQTQAQTFFRRQNGEEIPWLDCDSDKHFYTYETPIVAPPGRYLWVVLELVGTARKTPRIKSLRAQYPSHDLLRRLPEVYSRDAQVADFLQRFLAMPEGMLYDLDLKASLRHMLLDAWATPAQLLPWLASFMGLVIDQRWPVSAKRELVAHCTWLFRYRGTLMGLRRFIEIYINSRVTIIEHFKVRGLGGALVTDQGSDALTSNAVLGAGFRIGGSLAASTNQASINDVSIEDAIEKNAHRFSVIISASLSSEQMEVVHYLLETHRPAHTLYDICTVDAGMRAGLGLHIGLTSIVGKTSGFGQLQVGAFIVGRTDTVGSAGVGTTVGSSRLGDDSRVG